MSDIFFNSRKLPKGKNEYVAFLDIMGTKAHMTHSVHETANYIFKLHAAVLSAWRSEKYKGVFVYPVMDGAYITASSKLDMEKLLVRIYDSLAGVFIKELDDNKKFVIQAGLAYGRTIHGHNIPYSASKVFELELSYKNYILLGPAMIEAYECGAHASPFGINVAESAQKNNDENARQYGAFPDCWKWFKTEAIKLKVDKSLLATNLEYYFNIFKSTNHPLHYDVNKIDNHIQLLKDYFEVEVTP